MQKPLVARNASNIKMGTLRFVIDNGHRIIQDGAYYRALSGQETHCLLNLLLDYRTDIIVLSVTDQREQERKNKERQGRKKPKMTWIDGQWVEDVDIAELEREEEE